MNITSHSPNTPPLIIGKALADRETKDRTFLPDPDNIGVVILVFSSLAFISNIYLLTAETITGEPNDKESTFNKYPLPDNDYFKTILIGDFCVVDKSMVYRRGLPGKRHKYMWISAHHSSYAEMCLTLLTMSKMTTKSNNNNQTMMRL